MTKNERRFIEQRMEKYWQYASEDRHAWISSNFMDRESFVHYQMNEAVADAFRFLLLDLLDTELFVEEE